MNRNVLITSAGRRGMLVEFFRGALADLCPGGLVLAADCRPELSAACQLADHGLRVPRLDSPDYIPELLRVCDQHSVGLVVPTIDTELMLLAESRELFSRRGIEAAVSDEDLVGACQDKRQTGRLFGAMGMSVPAVRDPRAEEDYPILAKPYDGSAGAGLHVMGSLDDLRPELLDDPKMMFVQYLDPAQHDEYTVDAYYDRHGRLCCFVPRLRIETRSGEVSKSRTSVLAVQDRIGESLSRLVGARGCLSVQFFQNRETGRLFGIEINPRFGGGFPLSHSAGADYPRWLIQEYLLGDSVEFFDGWEPGLTMLRYDSHVLVRDAAA